MAPPSIDERIYIVTHDVSDPRRWRRLFKLMHGYGEWLQLSVFQCRLTQRRRVEFAAAINEVINHNQDHALILDLGSVERVELWVQSLGKAYAPVSREAIVV